MGAVITRDGKVVGEGYHRRAGEAHAEVMALREAGDAARGATLWVTLEPCASFGRTPPCVDAVVAAGIARVVACHRDPDPRTAGRGFAALRAAGIEVEVGAHAADALDLNLPFLVRTALGRPTVTLKWAASLDGRVATAGAQSQWITGARARRAALGLREEHDAVLVGSGTVLADDPRLTRRLGRAGAPNLRVLLDRRGRLPETARLLSEAGPVLVYTESDERAWRRRIEARGAEIVRLERVAPASVVSDLAARECGSVLVEGGPQVAGAFFDAALWDRVELFVAPLLFGGDAAPPALAGSGARALVDAGRLERLELRRRGDDLWIRGTNRECLRALSSSVGD